MAVGGGKVEMDRFPVPHVGIVRHDDAVSIHLNINKIRIPRKRHLNGVVATDIRESIGWGKVHQSVVNNQSVNVISRFRNHRVGLVASAGHRRRARRGDGAVRGTLCRNPVLRAAEHHLYRMVGDDIRETKLTLRFDTDSVQQD